MSSFMEMLAARWDEGKFVCVGLDSDYSKIPDVEPMRKAAYDAHPWPYAAVQLAFNKAIVDATADIVCAFKPNSAFYEALGWEGVQALERTIAYVKSNYPHIPVILDAKRADIGNTNNGYVTFAFDRLRADAITVHPYLGQEALKPFLDRADKGIIVLCRTSNPGAGEFQDLSTENSTNDKRPVLFRKVAERVSNQWNGNRNCALVVGATYPNELKVVRDIIGDMPILIPGIGAQGGDLEATVRAGRDSKSQGMIINSSRGIIFASKGEDFASAAREKTWELHDQITRCLQSA